ncbi:hypothetical protein KP509_12G050100 [Ceratopteris richardii]|uniref:Uncharacterized protein n=1 Tax=Ceratopteris richardii TaxID=49495 RepID=A0A8T2TLI7_CERRI|nr:hypothetical protein KP509_12G050100 [Ceratopteris richardii]
MAIVTRSLAKPPHVLKLIMAARIPKLLQLEVPEGSAGMKVAEILLECSVGHFLSSFPLENIFESQRASESKARATPLSADAEVSMHQRSSVYVILPISRVHTRLSKEEKASFCELLNKDRRHKLFRGRRRLIKFLSKKIARTFQPSGISKVTPFTEEIHCSDKDHKDSCSDDEEKTGLDNHTTEPHSLVTDAENCSPQPFFR